MNTTVVVFILLGGTLLITAIWYTNRHAIRRLREEQERIAALEGQLSKKLLAAQTRGARRRSQVQIGGDGSTQLQSGGTLIIPASVAESGQEIRINLPAVEDAEGNARKISARMGRHL